MTDREMSEVLEALNNINEDLEKQYVGTRYTTWSYACIAIGHNCIRIKIFGVTIWDDDNMDDRKWIERTTDDIPGINGWTEEIPAYYEPIEPYLRKKVNELVTSISSIKL